MPASDSPSSRTCLAALAYAAVAVGVSLQAQAQVASVDPVTGAELQDPVPTSG